MMKPKYLILVLAVMAMVLPVSAGLWIDNFNQDSSTNYSYISGVPTWVTSMNVVNVTPPGIYTIASVFLKKQSSYGNYTWNYTSFQDSVNGTNAFFWFGSPTFSDNGVGGDNTYRLRRINNSGSRIMQLEFVKGSYTILQANYGMPNVGNTPHIIMVKWTPQFINISEDGVQYLSVVNHSYTSGYAGFGIGGNNNKPIISFSNFTTDGILDSPISHFTYQTFPNKTVNFFDTSTNGATSWNWSFSDGNVSSLENPANIFPTYGNYTINLTVTNAVGSNTSLRTIYVTQWFDKYAQYGDSLTSPDNYFTGIMVPRYDPNAAFDRWGGVGATSTWLYDAMRGSYGSSYIYYNSSMEYFIWFGGMNDPNPANQINGTQTGITTDKICKFVEANGSICVPVIPPLPDPNGAEGNSTQHRLDYMAYLDSIHRQYVDGADATDTIPNNNHLDQFNSSNFIGDGVHLNTQGQNLTADYVWSHWYAFGGQTSGRNWSFGDNTQNSYEQNPIHTYTSAGTYTVNLTVTGASPVVAAFSANVTSSPSAPLTVQFTDTSTFGAGSTETKSNTTYIFIGGIPYSAGFTATPLNGTSPLTVQFLDQSVNATSWYYEFDNFLANSTVQNPNWTFTTVGNYSIHQKINSIYGYSWENKTNYIRVLPGLTDLICNNTGNITASLGSVTNNSMNWSWNHAQNITAVSIDSLFITTFDNSSNTISASGLQPQTWHTLRLYNATSNGTLICVTNASVTPTPTPYIPVVNPPSDNINWFDWWWVPTGLLILWFVSRKW
jgi:PKD repeat protein